MGQTEKRGGFDKNPDLILRYREGDSSAGEELVTLNTPLVYSIAGRFAGRGADMSDLIECGQIGLVKAINTFDVTRGCAFSTYAVPLIFGEIRRFLRDDGIIKVSREEKRLAALINREREERQQAGLATDLASLAAAVGVTVQDAASAVASEIPPRSLDERAFEDDDGATLGSIIADEDSGAAFDKLALRLAIESLDERGRQLIILRYFRDYSQAQCAAALGLSQVKVSREEKKIMETLRRAMV